MKTLEKKVWLCYHLYRKLKLIEKEPATGFSNNEKFFIKALNILYRVDKKHADYFAKRYKTLTNTKASKITSEIYSGEEII